MKRYEIKEILEKYYSEDSIKSILSGRRLPSMSRALEMSDDIPISAWQDIKSFITDNSISNQSTKSTTQKEKGVA